MKAVKEKSKKLANRIHLALRKLIPSQKERLRLEMLVGPIGKWDILRQFQLEALLKNGLQPHHSLLDIGCGPLQGGVAFIQYLDKSRIPLSCNSFFNTVAQLPPKLGGYIPLPVERYKKNKRHSDI